MFCSIEVCQERPSLLDQSLPEANRKCFTYIGSGNVKGDIYYIAFSIFIAQLADTSGCYYLALVGIHHFKNDFLSRRIVSGGETN